MDHLTREPIGCLSPDQIAGGTSDERVARTEAKPDEYYRCQRPEVLDLVPRDAKTVLDVGCGAATLGAAIKRRQQAVVHGVEPVAEAAAAAARELDHVWNVPVEAALPLLQDGFYDCIVLADVLEHMIDPWSALRSLRAKLAPSGKVIASIPNVQNWGVVASLLQGRFDYEWEGILDGTHLRFFTRRTAEALFWNAGYRIVRLTCTKRGPEVPRALLKYCTQLGMDVSALSADARTWQFLVEAELPQPTKRNVAIVILNWNGLADTLECLASTQKLDYGSFSTIVVDNGSIDGSVPAIRSVYPDVTIIETGRNLGYAGGNNVGIRHALRTGADAVLVLNNDTVVRPDLLACLTRAANVLPEGAILGAGVREYRQPEATWLLGGNWDGLALRFEVAGGGKPWGRREQPYREVDQVVGCALYLPKEALQVVGEFDERFFLHFEEIDYCFRARRLGFRCFVISDARLWHKGGASFGGSKTALAQYFMTRNQLLWAEKHLTKRQARAIRRGVRQALARAIVPSLGISLQRAANPRKLYWAVREWVRRIRANASLPMRRAKCLGLRDYYLRRFGDCPDEVRLLDKGRGA